MSAALYPVRVYFEPERRGLIKVPGVTRVVNEPPHIPGLPKLTAIDYAPGVCCELMPQFEAKREMTAKEIDAIKHWLNNVQKGLA